MAEKVINEPLAGSEIKKSLLAQVERALSGQTHALSDNHSYEIFWGTITIKAQLRDVGRIDTVDVTVSSKIGQVPEDENPDLYLEQFEETVPIEEAAPNTVREESHQPIPVLTSENGKPVVKRVTYARKGAKK